MSALERDPRVRVHLEDIRRETAECLVAHRVAGRGIVADARKLRDSLTEVGCLTEEKTVADHDDSPASVLTEARITAIEAGEVDVLAFPFLRNDAVLPALGLLVGVVRERCLAWFREGQQQKALERADQALRTLGERRLLLDEAEGALRTRFIRDAETLPGAALERLEKIAVAVDAPVAIGMSDAIAKRLSGSVEPGLLSLMRVRNEILGRHGESFGPNELEPFMAMLNVQVVHLCTEIHARIGSVRSHRALVDRFKERCELYDRDRRFAQAMRMKTPQARVLTNEAGGTPSRQMVLNRLKALEQKLGMRAWSFHSLRHYFCSTLIRRGANLEAVRVLAGHSKLEITQGYVHANANDLEQAIACFGATDGKR